MTSCLTCAKGFELITENLSSFKWNYPSQACCCSASSALSTITCFKGEYFFRALRYPIFRFSFIKSDADEFFSSCAFLLLSHPTTSLIVRVMWHNERLYGNMSIIFVMSYIVPYMFSSCTAGSYYCTNLFIFHWLFHLNTHRLREFHCSEERAKRTRSSSRKVGEAEGWKLMEKFWVRLPPLSDNSLLTYDTSD